MTAEKINKITKDIFKPSNKPYITILGNTDCVKIPSYSTPLKMLLKDIEK